MPVVVDARIKVLAAATGLKLALAPGYRSTDFEVHRNWLAVTYTLQLKEWYLDATSEWTLDYPPLFAYFERALACLARVVAPRALTLQREPLEGDPATVAFQRLSVVAADLLLAAVAWRLTSTSKNKKSKKTSSSSSFPSWVPFLLVFASPGLLIVDSIHFQYNAPLIALLLLAVSEAARSGGSGSGSRNDLAAAAAFAVLVCSKHLFACLGPLFALHLLGRCLGRGKAAMLEDAKKRGGKKKGKVASAVAAAFAASASHALALAAVVAAVVAAAFAPFALSMPSLKPLLERLFPFDRGLLHAYWAANAWALVAGADVALSAALRVVAPKVEALLLPVTTAAAGTAGTTTTATTTITTTIAKTSSSFLSSLAEGRGSGLASGLVQRTEFAVLPTPSAGAAALCVLLAQAPALLSALRSGFASASASSSSRKKSTPSFAAAAQYCLLCSFVWGYHVHEKAILPALAMSAWRAFCDETGESDDDDDDDDGNRDDTNNDDGRGIARGPRSYFWLSLPALHALLPLLAPARGLERAAAFLLLVAHALFLLSLDTFVIKARRSPPSSSLFSSSPPLLERAAALLLCSLEVACVLAWPLLAPPRLAERLPFAPLAATSLVCAAGVCGCWLADALRWWRVALFRGGRGGGKDLEGKKKKVSTTTTVTGRKAVPATAAVTDAAASTKATTSASPSLAARRPRRAAAAAAAKA